MGRFLPWASPAPPGDRYVVADGIILSVQECVWRTGVLSLRVHGHFSFNAEIVRRIVRVGIPAAVEQGLMRSAQLIYGMIVAGMDTVSIAAPRWP